MDTRKERVSLIKLSTQALEKIKAVIPQDIDTTDPEKVKVSVQGKMEAINACKQIISTIEELKSLNDEQNSDKVEGKDNTFAGIEQLVGKK